MNNSSLYGFARMKKSVIGLVEDTEDYVSVIENAALYSKSEHAEIYIDGGLLEKLANSSSYEVEGVKNSIVILHKRKNRYENVSFSKVGGANLYAIRKLVTRSGSVFELTCDMDWRSEVKCIVLMDSQKYDELRSSTTKQGR